MWLVNRMPIAEKWSVPRGRVKLLLNSVCVAIRMAAKGVIIEGGPDTRPRGTEGGSQLPAQCTGLDVTETWWRNVTSLGGLQGEDRTLPGSRGGEGVPKGLQMFRHVIADVSRVSHILSHTFRAHYAHFTRTLRGIHAGSYAHYAHITRHYAHITRTFCGIHAGSYAHYYVRVMCAYCARTVRVLCA